jgi:hypothetical protein
MSVELQGSTVGDWAETLALAVFTGAPIVPEASFEQKANRRFHELEVEIANLKDDIADLQNEMADFKWQVQTLLYEAREEDIWQTMPQIENSADAHYKRLKLLGDSKESIEIRKKRSLELADMILASSLVENIDNTQLAFVGSTVGAGKQRVRGFLEIWRQQALSEADLDWKGDRLQQILQIGTSPIREGRLGQRNCIGDSGDRIGLQRVCEWRVRRAVVCKQGYDHAAARLGSGSSWNRAGIDLDEHPHR